MDNMSATFNILLEDGGILKDCKVLSSKGLARNAKDVLNAFYFEHQVCIANKEFRNYIIKGKDFYYVEETVKSLIANQNISNQNL